MTTHLIIPDPHAHYEHNNDRADWLGKLIADVRPDVVINMGDQWDMPSLSAYDKGHKIMGRTYKADIDAGLEFSDRLWGPTKRRKKKKPRMVFLEGNHEDRITRALELSPTLRGTISFDDLDLKAYDDIVRYEGDTPGNITIDGVTYAHYFISGVLGRALGGEHPAHALLSKGFVSCTAAHTHTMDFCVRTDVQGRSRMGFVCGCYLDYDADWAGMRNRLWQKGVAIKRNVEDGVYDLQWVSLDALRKEYNG